MSVGNNLQEMENVVTKGAAAADPMPKMADPGTQLGNVEDLGGPTPENYRVDDDSAKLKDAGAILAQVRDVVNKGAKPAEAMPKMAKEEEEIEGEVVYEEEETDEEVVSEEETSEEEVIEETIDVEEDVNALLEGEDLSEEFQEKARTIFEAAIRSRIAEVKEEIEQQYESALIEEVVAIKEQLTDRVDAYLEYVADEWMQENQLAIDHGLKTEMTESFLVGMKSLFEDHYVSIPEEKYDVLSTMVEKLDEMEDKLNEQIERNIALNQRLAESVADVIFSEVCEGLALSQKDKLASLAENVEFDSEENYREKLVTLRKSYFPENAGTQRDKSDTISEETTETKESVSGLMETYLSTLNRVSKK
jgi:AcrR family transcriptional regulator